MNNFEIKERQQLLRWAVEYNEKRLKFNFEKVPQTEVLCISSRKGNDVEVKYQNVSAGWFKNKQFIFIPAWELNWGDSIAEIIKIIHTKWRKIDGVIFDQCCMGVGFQYGFHLIEKDGSLGPMSVVSFDKEFLNEKDLIEYFKPVNE